MQHGKKYAQEKKDDQLEKQIESILKNLAELEKQGLVTNTDNYAGWENSLMSLINKDSLEMLHLKLLTEPKFVSNKRKKSSVSTKLYEISESTRNISMTKFNNTKTTSRIVEESTTKYSCETDLCNFVAQEQEEEEEEECWFQQNWTLQILL